MVQLLYISNRECPDIQFVVSLLCTRVREPDADDYNKVAMVMKYLQGNIGLPFILSINKSVNIKWYIDESFTVHKDMRSQTGGFMTMGTVGAYVQYRGLN